MRPFCLLLLPWCCLPIVAPSTTKGDSSASSPLSVASLLCGREELFPSPFCVPLSLLVLELGVLGHGGFG